MQSVAKNLSNQPSLTTRSQAAAIIERWLDTGDFPNQMLEDVREHRAFLMELVYGIVRWKRLLPSRSPCFGGCRKVA